VLSEYHGVVQRVRGRQRRAGHFELLRDIHDD
jgi:hypothetical protein